MRLVSLAALLPLALAVPNDEVLNRGEEHPFIHVPLAHPDAYTSGEVHGLMMQMLSDSIAQMEADRQSLLGMHAITEYTPCVGGYAGTDESNTFACNNLDLYSFTPHADLGSKTEFGNDIWGWTHTERGVSREFALVGEADGTAFVEVLPSGQVAYLGRLPTQTVNSTWRDIKVIGNHAYIGSEALGHGVQVFDLTKAFLSISLSSKVLIDDSFWTLLWSRSPRSSASRAIWLPTTTPSPSAPPTISSRTS